MWLQSDNTAGRLSSDDPISSNIGYIYIIVSESFPNWVKIGVTGNLKKRLQVYQTCSPFRDYSIIYSIEHPEYMLAEARIAETEGPFAKRIKGEWYEMSRDMAISRLDEVLECWGEPRIDLIK